MIALCVIVVAVPSQRRPSRQFRDYWSGKRGMHAGCAKPIRASI